MHDDHMLDDTAATIRRSAPLNPGPDTLDTVLAAAVEGAPNVGQGRVRDLWTPRRLMRPALAIAVVVAIGVAVAVLSPSQTTSAFAKEDALAALKPPAGQILHAVTRSYAVNEGGPVPADEVMSHDEHWVDAAGNRSRSKSIDASTGAVVMDVLGAEGRFRARGEGLFEPIESGVAVTSGYTNGSVLGMALGDYEYIRNSLPEGKVVGEVTRAGEKYWDVRWTNVKDENGHKLSARALFRIPDYRPALLERSYPGGATTHWEVLKWEFIPESDLATDTFDVASVGQPGMLEGNVWYPKDLAANVDYPVYWAGPKLGTRTVTMSSDGSLGDTPNPWFVEVLNGRSALDIALGKSRTYIEYIASDGATVTVTTGAPISQKSLAGRLGSLAEENGSSEYVASAIGTATIVTSPDGTQFAGVALDRATVVVATSDSDAMTEALRELRLAR